MIDTRAKCDALTILVRSFSTGSDFEISASVQRAKSCKVVNFSFFLVARDLVNDLIICKGSTWLQLTCKGSNETPRARAFQRCDYLKSGVVKAKSCAMLLGTESIL